MKKMRWAFAQREHDYEASWDHEAARVSREDRRTIRAIPHELHATLLPELGLFKRFRLFFADLGDRCWLASYSDSTYSEPVIVLAVAANRAAAEKYGTSFDLAIETSIVHELGHAIQECAGAPKRECGAEAFARVWYEDRQVEPSFERMAQALRFA